MTGEARYNLWLLTKDATLHFFFFYFVFNLGCVSTDCIRDTKLVPTSLKNVYQREKLMILSRNMDNSKCNTVVVGVGCQ